MNVDVLPLPASYNYLGVSASQYHNWMIKKTPDGRVYFIREGIGFEGTGSANLSIVYPKYVSHHRLSSDLPTQVRTSYFVECGSRNFKDHGWTELYCLYSNDNDALIDNSGEFKSENKIRFRKGGYYKVRFTQGCSTGVAYSSGYAYYKKCHRLVQRPLHPLMLESTDYTTVS